MTTPEARRAANLLGVSWAVAWAGVPISAAFGSVIVLEMTDNLALTGVPYFLMYVGSLLAAYPAGHLMDRYGRIPVLIAGHLVAALGFFIGLAAILLNNLWLFLFAQVVVAMGAAGTYLTRLAAADLYPAAERARGLGRLVTYLVIGAAASVPLLMGAQRLEPILGRSYLVVAWIFIPVLSIASAYIVSRVKVDPKTIAQQLAREEQAAAPQDAPPTPARIPWRVILPTAAVMLFAQATMASLMSVSGAALTHAHYGPEFVIMTLTLHVIGMFGLSSLVGTIGDRFGRRTLLLTSAAYLACASLITVFVPAGVALTLTLIAVGIGWSFAFIGATTVLADAVPAARRGRVMGGLDVAVAIVGAVASLSAGWALESGGIPRVALLGFGLACGVILGALVAPSVKRVVASAKPLPAGDNVGK